MHFHLFIFNRANGIEQAFAKLNYPHPNPLPPTGRGVLSQSTCVDTYALKRNELYQQENRVDLRIAVVRNY